MSKNNNFFYFPIEMSNDINFRGGVKNNEGKEIVLKSLIGVPCLSADGIFEIQIKKEY